MARTTISCTQVGFAHSVQSIVRLDGQESFDQVARQGAEIGRDRLIGPTAAVRSHFGARRQPDSEARLKARSGAVAGDGQLQPRPCECA
jgi:hypothetical protein